MGDVWEDRYRRSVRSQRERERERDLGLELYQLVVHIRAKERERSALRDRTVPSEEEYMPRD